MGIINLIILSGQSTGDFKIRSYYQSVLVDSNENFGTIGFAPQYISYICI